MSTDQTQGQPRERLAAMLTEPLSALGLDLEDLEILSAGKRSVLRIGLDSDHGVTLDEVADATRTISGLLDDSDVMGNRPYTLEVGSRGVDRPLTLPRHWRRNVGRLVKVTDGQGQKFTGRLTAADEEHATVDVTGRARQVRLSEVRSARVQVEFSPPKNAGTPSTDEE